MSPEPTKIRQLKTWSYLHDKKKRPREYDIVARRGVYNSRKPDSALELDPDLPMNQWFRRYRRDGSLQHREWDAFTDPGRLTYRIYVASQDHQESYVDGLLGEYSRIDHDRRLDPTWVAMLRRFYTPGRYVLHAQQMCAGYIAMMAPSSTIVNCVGFQAGDALRWLSRTAYRTAELRRTQPDEGFGQDERRIWEDDPAWQGIREAVERLLTTFDWGEALIAMNVVVKPAIDECYLRQLGQAARRNGDELLALLNDAQWLDSERSRRWTSAFVWFCKDERSENGEEIARHVRKWEPVVDKAIEAYCGELWHDQNAVTEATRGAAEFRRDLGIEV